MSQSLFFKDYHFNFQFKHKKRSSELNHIKKQIRRSIEAMDKTTTPPIDCSIDLIESKSSNIEIGQS